jgi:Zn-finger protein
MKDFTIDGRNVVVLRELEPDICENCGKNDELRPYGKRKENGHRMWVCYDCGMLDKEEATKAFHERLEGKISI